MERDPSTLPELKATLTLSVCWSSLLEQNLVVEYDASTYIISFNNCVMWMRMIIEKHFKST